MGLKVFLDECLCLSLFQKDIVLGNLILGILERRRKSPDNERVACADPKKRTVANDNKTVGRIYGKFY